MGLSTDQHRFSRDMTKLLTYAFKLGIEVSIGEVYRDPEWQKVMVQRGKSRTLNSRHTLKLAVDLFLFRELDKSHPGLEFDQAFATYEKLGTYWESLGPGHVWGGRWPTLRDSVHFELTPSK